MKRLALLLLCAGPVCAQNEWTQRVVPLNRGAGIITGRPGLYLCRDTVSGYLRSVDGVTWTLADLPFAERLYTFGQRIIGIASSGFWWTDDGLSSVPAQMGGVTNINSAHLAMGAGVLVCIDSAGRILRSIDNGASWTPILSPAATLAELAYGNGQFITRYSGSFTLRSPDGLTWTTGPSYPGSGLAFALNTWRTNSDWSPDALTWNAGPAPHPDTFRAAPDSFYCWRERELRRNTTTAINAWTGVTLPILDNITDVQHCGDLWIATTASGKLLTSPATPLPPLQIAAVNINPAVALSWPTQAGRSYVVQRSTDNLLWANATAPMLGDGSPLQWMTPAHDGREFFRVQAR